MKYLPDTNIFILAIQNHPAEAKILKKFIEKKALIISAVVIAEFYGKGEIPREEEKAFSKLVSHFSTLPVDSEVAKMAGEYRSQFLRKTKRVFIMDCMLAAQAKVHNLTLVTNNTTDFPMKDIKVISPTRLT